MNNLNLTSTDDLAAELANRFTSLIIIGLQEDGQKESRLFETWAGSTISHIGMARYIEDTIETAYDDMFNLDY